MAIVNIDLENPDWMEKIKVLPKELEKSFDDMPNEMLDFASKLKGINNLIIVGEDDSIKDKWEGEATFVVANAGTKFEISKTEIYKSDFPGEWITNKLESGVLLSVEGLYDGVEGSIIKKDKDILLSEPELMSKGLNSLESIPIDFTLTCSCSIINNNPIISLVDSSMINKDLSSLTYQDRKVELKKFFEKYLEKSSVFKLSSSVIVKDEEEFLKAFDSFHDSTEIIVKDLDTGDKIKVSNVLELNVEVLEKQRTRSGAFVYTYGVKK